MYNDGKKARSPCPVGRPVGCATAEYGYCTEWNPAMEKPGGAAARRGAGQDGDGDVFGTLCRLKSSDAMTKFMIILNNAMDGQDTERFPFPSSTARSAIPPLLHSTPSPPSASSLLCFALLGSGGGSALLCRWFCFALRVILLCWSLCFAAGSTEVTWCDVWCDVV